jgi:superfamily II DNA/RNA helicase
VAKSLSHSAKFSSALLSSSGSKSDQKAALAAPLDIVFATPGRLLQHNEEGAVHLGDVKWVVVDEADTMILKVGAGALTAVKRRRAPG